MPNSLRAGLWDAISASFFQSRAEFDIIGRQETLDAGFKNITDAFWFNVLKRPTDELRWNAEDRLGQIRGIFFKAEFFEVYEVAEFFANVDCSGLHSMSGGIDFATFCNRVLAREKSAFRFAETTLVRVTDEMELEEVSKSIGNQSTITVRQHIRRAAELFSQQPKPDFRNSIKESISAVEAAVQELSGKRTSGVDKPLKMIEDVLPVHPALRQGFEKLYAFTSDESGIRHALLDEDRVTESQARYMLVSCSAFANFLLAQKFS